MIQKISKGLYAFITLTILLVSAFFMVKAIETKEVIKEVEKTTVLAPIWFEYTGDPNNQQEMEDPQNYDPILDQTGNPTEPECEEGDFLCAVKVTPDPLNTDLPDEDELKEVLENNEESPDESEIRHKP